MRAIDRVKAHFSANKMSVVEVPEWGAKSEPFKLYYHPMTPYERKEIFGADSGVFDAEAAVETVLLKALDADGNKLFEQSDRHELLTHSDGAITGRIAMQIVMPTDKKAVEKN